MKKYILLSTIIVSLVLSVSCNSISTATEQVASFLPSDQPTISDILETDTAVCENVVLTSAQYDKINALLSGALSMSGGVGEATFFQDSSELSTENLIGFAYTILCDEPRSIGREFMDTGTISSEVIKDIIRSAFGLDYTPQKGDSFGSVLQYNGSSFDYEGSDGLPTYAYPYSITRQSSGNLLMKINIAYDAIPEVYYLCNGEAVIQEDAESLFGFRLVSLTKDDENIAFTGAEASSSIPTNSLLTYEAENAIDGDDNTAWAARDGKGEWIKLAFDKAQEITGLVLHFGDRSSYDAFSEHAMPLSFEIEFSDGTCQSYDEFEVLDISGDPFINFERTINTFYVKLTITDIVPGTTGESVFISEIKPF